MRSDCTVLISSDYYRRVMPWNETEDVFTSYSVFIYLISGLKQIKSRQIRLNCNLQIRLYRLKYDTRLIVPNQTNFYLTTVDFVTLNQSDHF